VFTEESLKCSGSKLLCIKDVANCFTKALYATPTILFPGQTVGFGLYKAAVQSLLLLRCAQTLRTRWTLQFLEAYSTTTECGLNTDIRVYGGDTCIL
jgi:hypothetical protein